MLRTAWLLRLAQGLVVHLCNQPEERWSHLAAKPLSVAMPDPALLVKACSLIPWLCSPVTSSRLTADSSSSCPWHLSVPAVCTILLIRGCIAPSSRCSSHAPPMLRLPAVEQPAPRWFGKLACALCLQTDAMAQPGLQAQTCCSCTQAKPDVLQAGRAVAAGPGTAQC